MTIVYMDLKVEIYYFQIPSFFFSFHTKLLNLSDYESKEGNGYVC